MNWRETWRETVQSFLRELREPGEEGAPPRPGDPLITAIAAARAELGVVERELEAARARLDTEEEGALVCERRRAQAERIGDADTARVAEGFARRHAERAAVLVRKCEVLEAEIRLARAALNELLDYARADGPPTTAWPPRSVT